MPRAVSRRASAKINLALAVAPPRASDNLHPICSWFAPIDLADEVRVERLDERASSRLDIRWSAAAPRPTPIDWPIERDLAFRAHALLERESGRPLPAAITLTKRIPVGGGLGGGSSDAAATLLVLRELFTLDIDDARLRALGLALGSDAPYFLLDPPTPAVVEGVGEIVTPTPPVVGSLILIIPPFGCDTASVYRAFDAGPRGAFRAEAVRALARSATLDPAVLFNDLADAAEAVQPRLADLRRRAAEAARAPVHITGSGSAMFIACDTASDRDALAAALRPALPECAVLPSRLL